MSTWRTAVCLSDRGVGSGEAGKSALKTDGFQQGLSVPSPPLRLRSVLRKHSPPVVFRLYARISQNKPPRLADRPSPLSVAQYVVIETGKIMPFLVPANEAVKERHLRPAFDDHLPAGA